MLYILVEVISRTFGNFLQRHKLWQFVTQMASICANLQIDSEARKCEEHLRSGAVNSFKLWSLHQFQEVSTGR